MSDRPQAPRQAALAKVSALLMKHAPAHAVDIFDAVLELDAATRDEIVDTVRTALEQKP